MQTFLNITQIVLSIVLIAVILLQAKGTGIGGIFGGGTSTFRVRRGLEKTLFQLTVVLVVIFVAISLIRAWAGAS